MKTIDPPIEPNDVKVMITTTCRACGGEPPPITEETGGCSHCGSSGRTITFLPLARLRDLFAEFEEPHPEEPGSEPEPIELDDRALVCWPGVFHEPIPGNERKADHFEVVAGIGRLKVSFDFRFGGFDADGSYALIWCHRGPWRGPRMKWAGNQLAYLNLISRDGEVRLQQRVSVAPESTSNRKSRVSRELQVGHWYHLQYIYDGSARVASTVLTLDQGPIAAIREQGDDIRSSLTNSRSGCSLVIGHSADEAGPEQPSYGWAWANLVLHGYTE
ncbi:MAG: hypothetical protein GY856_34035 [bacterium]|nr:hypothetical protein [bacterium]